MKPISRAIAYRSSKWIKKCHQTTIRTSLILDSLQMQLRETSTKLRFSSLQLSRVGLNIRWPLRVFFWRFSQFQGNDFHLIRPMLDMNNICFYGTCVLKDRALFSWHHLYVAVIDNLALLVNNGDMHEAKVGQRNKWSDNLPSEHVGSCQKNISRNLQNEPLYNTGHLLRRENKIIQVVLQRWGSI